MLKESHFTLIYNNIADLVFLVEVELDNGYRFLSVNKSYLAATGYTEEQVVGKRVQEIYSKTASLFLIQKFKEAIELEKTICFDEITDFPKRKLILETKITPIFDNKGYCTHLLGVARDNTERKQLEDALWQVQAKYSSLVEQMPAITGRRLFEEQVELERQQLISVFDCLDESIYVSDPDRYAGFKQAVDALRMSEEFLQKMADTVPIPIFYKDAKGRYIGCNTLFESYTGLTREEIRGKSVYELNLKNADTHYEKDMELFNNPGIQVYESTVGHADGSIHNVIFNKVLKTTLFGGSLITDSGGCQGTPNKVVNRLGISANGGGHFIKVPECPPLLAVG